MAIKARPPMSKDTITRQEYHQLVGLLALAEKHIQKVEDIHDVARDITGEDDDFGFTGEAIYEPSRRDADGLLGRLGVEVEDAGSDGA